MADGSRRQRGVKETQTSYRARTRPSPGVRTTLDDPPPDSRDVETRWMEEHRSELHRRYAGQWIVVEGEAVIAHHRNLQEAVGRASAGGIRCPFVVFVRLKRYEEAYEIAWLRFT